MKFLIDGATEGRGDGLDRTVALSLIEPGHKVRRLRRERAEADSERDRALEAVDILVESGQVRTTGVAREPAPDVIWSFCGTGYPTPLRAMPDAEIESMIHANVSNNIVFCRTCAPSRPGGGSHPILTGSVAPPGDRGIETESLHEKGTLHG